MPRDGSNIYHRPPGTDGIPNYTIESAKYNANVADVEQDLNLPRPIVAGGTGASSADVALFNLKGETAAQTVTNWDSQAWLPGSFYAASTATGAAPVPAHAFAGICYINEPLANPPTGQNLVLEARDLDANLAVTQWLNLTLYVIGNSVRDTADNTIWKVAQDHITGAAPLTFAQLRAAQPTLYVAAPAIPVTKYIRVKKAGVWNAWAPETIAQSVRYDAGQILTTGEQAQARKNIYAAPFDALAYNGMQINGSFEVSQEYGATPSTLWVGDVWSVVKSGTFAVSAYAAPGIAVFGFSNTLQVLIATGQPTLGASDRAGVAHTIEGYRMSRLSWGFAPAQPITIAFWSIHHRPGLYSGTIRNAATDLSYAFTYTHAAADTPQYNVITIPGPTSGTWGSTNGPGLYLTFSMGCGSTFTAPSVNAWLTGNYLAAPGQINAVAATSDAFKITGVVVLPGIEAPSAARSPLIMRPYDQELLTCKRYWKANADVMGHWLEASNAQAVFSIQHNIEMRSAPVVAPYGSGVNAIVRPGIGLVTVTGINTSVATTRGSLVYLNTAVAAANVPAHLTAGYLSLDARL